MFCPTSPPVPLLRIIFIRDIITLKGGDYMFDNIVSLISVCISALTVFVSALTVWYQTSRSQALEKERIKLEIYSRFIAYCQKKASGTATADDVFELAKAHSQLMLIVDYKLNEDISNLYDHLFKEPCSIETIQLLDKVTQRMWLNLKSFNQPRFYHLFRRH